MSPTRHSRRQNVLYSLPFFLLWACGGSEPPPAEAPAASNAVEDQASIEDRLPDLLEQGRIPGLAIAIVQDGKTVLDQGFGTTGSADGETVTSDTIFEAASLSKPVFALGAMILVERGQLDLDHPLTSYLPYPDVQDDARLDQITARHVLSHSTGFPNWRRGNPLTIGFDPGTRFRYSGEGYVFLQKVVEHLTGQRLNDYLTREVFEPLSMTSSSFLWRADYDQRSATGHDLLGGSREKFRPETENAAASLHTTAGDFARFLGEMMAPSLITPETAQQMLTPEVNVEDGISWGLGWGLEEVTVDGSNDRLFWHWGDNGSFRCLTAASADRRVGVVYFTNSENGLAIANEVLQRTVGGDHHPGMAWQDYPAYDSPTFQIQQAFLRNGIGGDGEAIRSAYEHLRETLDVASFDENAVNRIGYGLLRHEATESAAEVFRINVENYPSSWNVYDSLGEALMGLEDREGAIANYEKSLELNPENDNAREMLAKLRE